MDAYLKRTYGQKRTGNGQNKYPFWDYRSRRGSLSASASNSSNDGSSISSIGSLRSETESENISLSGNSDIDSIMLSDPYRMTVHFLADAHEIYPMMDMYQPVIDWVDPDLHIFKISERTDFSDGDNQSFSMQTSYLPSVSLMVFLHEEGMLGCERIQNAKRHFEKSPWKFHHSEEVSRGRVNPYPYNSQDFYYTSEDLPLWAVRQVHYGKEHIRVVVFASEENWNDMVQFYKIIIGTEPDLNRNDFCLFTIHTHLNYDVQFALKKIQSDIKPRALDCVKLQFRVTDVGQIVPLFPNVCKPLSDTRWQTTDHDGNVIVLEVTGCNLSPSDKTSHVSRHSSDRSNRSDQSGRLSHRSDQSDRLSRRSDQSDSLSNRSDQSDRLSHRSDQSDRSSQNSLNSGNSDRTVQLSSFYV
ncbi:protein FAM124A-like isoform X1 [Argopecten irradians]|uniref:protein FAM124A-like isoform X1 n=1 Tax=Argopecten irradians TaxID=31199 RepID=UPI0037232B3E